VASSKVKTQKNPAQFHLADGTVFACPCKSTEFRITHEGVPLHLFCRCGQIYTIGDLPPLKDGEVNED
jgi:hypothetical protein